MKAVAFRGRYSIGSNSRIRKSRYIEQVFNVNCLGYDSSCNYHKVLTCKSQEYQQTWGTINRTLNTVLEEKHSYSLTQSRRSLCYCMDLKTGHWIELVGAGLEEQKCNFYYEYWTQPLSWLTPWSRILIEKAPVAQLLKNFPKFYGTRRFITVFIWVRHWSLPWAWLIQSYLSKTHFNIIIPPMSRFSSWSVFLFAPMRAAFPA
jgi:hypothetical protein